MLDSNKDTIAAICTPLGKGGVGIVRISGENSLSISLKFFKSSKKNFAGIKPYRLHHGYFISPQGKILDEVLLAYMPKPGSYTGEDVVEINCHGGPAILQLILEELLASGARLAKPGEFTYRAFLNGKMDLTQAEAVIELINAPTKEAIPLAQQKLQGLLQQKIQTLKKNLETLRQEFCVAVDFPDEDLECLPPEKIQTKVQKTIEEINALLAAYEQKHLYQDGALVVIAGRVNAGKSSLLNALIGKERAIVTPIPGTTRDYLEEYINIQGIPVRLVDTAGLRETKDEVENIGLQKGLELILQSDLCLLLVDIRENFSTYEQNILEKIPHHKIFVVLNKIDLSSTMPKWTENINPKIPIFKISAQTGKGLKELSKAIGKQLLGTQKESSSTLVPNLRQKKCLEKAVSELNLLLQHLFEMPYDLLSVHLDLACQHLKEITGEITSEEVLNQIFENFCIGK
ncbi:tRNA uridine-5-carboxymethylaminomethyl(34) synthesis GTPase MnmE [Desulfonauticus submarinus]